MSETQITKVQTLKEYIARDDVQKRVQEMLKDKASGFILTMISLVNNNSAYANVEPQSLINAALSLTVLDLPMTPGLGLGWIIPYNDKKTGKKLAQAQLGYKAFVQLSIRSKKFARINVTEVRKGEFLGIDRLSGDIQFKWEEDEAKRTKLPVVGYVAYFKLHDGFEKSLYMTSAEALAHGQKYSQGFKKYGSGLWKDEFDAMAKKTVIKLLLSRYAPMSVDLVKAQEIDQAVIVDEKTRYIDNEKQSSEEIAEEKEHNRIERFIKACRSLKALEVCKNSCTTDELVALYKEKEAKLQTGPQGSSIALSDQTAPTPEAAGVPNDTSTS